MSSKGVNLSAAIDHQLQGKLFSAFESEGRRSLRKRMGRPFDRMAAEAYQRTFPFSAGEEDPEKYADRFKNTYERFARRLIARGFAHAPLATRFHDAQCLAKAYEGYLLSGRVYFSARCLVLPPDDAGRKEPVDARIREAGDAAALFQCIAESLCGNPAMQAHALSIVRMYGNAIAGSSDALERMERALVDSTTTSLMQGGIATFESWMFDHLRGTLEQVVRDIDAGAVVDSSDENNTAAAPFMRAWEFLTRAQNVMPPFYYDGIKKMIKRAAGVDAATSVAWNGVSEDMYFLFHDFGNIFYQLSNGSMNRCFDKYNTPGEQDGEWTIHRPGDVISDPEVARREGMKQCREDVSAMAKALDFSTVGSLFNAIHKLKAHYWKDIDFQIQLGDASGIAVPDGARRDLFRIIFELALNSLKYTDKEKPSNLIRLIAAREGQRLSLSAYDNGVGVKDVVNVQRLGVREREDLADGTGTGLAGVNRLAGKHGWEFQLSSKLGEWTEGKLLIDLSEWESEANAATAPDFIEGAEGEQQSLSPDADAAVTELAEPLGLDLSQPMTIANPAKLL